MNSEIGAARPNREHAQRGRPAIRHWESDTRGRRGPDITTGSTVPSLVGHPLRARDGIQANTSRRY